jgi:purine-binding chemotaxis protein CheW
MPSFLLGMINLRGMVLPIMDLRKRFEMAEYETGPFTVIIIVQIRSKVIGVVVDSVVDVVNLQQENLLEAPEESTELDSKFVKGLANLRGEMVILLDLEQLLAPDELEQLSMLR